MTAGYTVVETTMDAKMTATSNNINSLILPLPETVDRFAPRSGNQHRGGRLNG